MTMPFQTSIREGLDSDPLWYKSGVIYEAHVRAFCDSDADGTGDFRGLTQKLDYIRDLGVTAVWLLPFYPSPLKDDGYDIADYCNVHPTYGTLGDFKLFLREAHRRRLRVITELVLNHTSNQHRWFQRARRARPGTRWRNFYVWSETGREYKDARVIFNDVEASNWAWDPVANAYYWHRFFSHQPDLNFENPEVHAAIFKVIDFWLGLGVDGLRLDAVPYLYEKEGTDCENLPETHAFLKKLRAYVDGKYSDRMLLAEANQWPEDAAAYFGQGRGDECHMAFHFPLMPRLFMALRMEDRLPIVEIMGQTPPAPETSQWALFLRNHDELTLEMVTDEERDYMYRMYAQMRQARLNLGIRRRLAPLLGNDRRRIELLHGLLFSLPGTPVLYYGDEIGLGENLYLGDRNGVRTPMQWSSDKNAGFSRANPQGLYLPIILDPEYHYEAVNVDAQLGNQHSLLWWMRRVLALRKRWRSLGEGKCEFLHPQNRKILSYLLRFEQEIILVVANLSRFVQPVELDLAACQQLVPVELFGRREFPPITDRPYFLTLGPHAIFWFSLEPSRSAAKDGSPAKAVTPRALLTVNSDWPQLFAGMRRAAFEQALSGYLPAQPWFAGRATAIRSVNLAEVVEVPLANGPRAFLTLLRVEYPEGDGETYCLPLALVEGDEAQSIREKSPHFVVADLAVAGRQPPGVLCDALACPAFWAAVLGQVWHRRRLKGEHGETEPQSNGALRPLILESTSAEAAPAKGEHHNSIVLFGDKLVLRLFRRVEPGINPALELGNFLTRKGFPNAPAIAGALEYVGGDQRRLTLAVLTPFVPGADTARAFTLDALGRYYDRVSTCVAQNQEAPHSPPDSLKLLELAIPPEVAEVMGTHLESLRLLGTRLAELHLTLASATDQPDLAPEPFTPHYQRGLFQSMRNQAARHFRLLHTRAANLPAELAPLAQKVLELEPAATRLYQSVFLSPLAAQRIRIHGDCQLSQVLWTGRDFMFVDFAGNAAVPLSERRFKRSPLRDVAGLVRSFHYAAYEELHRHVERGGSSHESVPAFQSWVDYWDVWASVAFLQAYFHRLGLTGLLPLEETKLRALLRAYVFHEILGEIARELLRESDRLRIALHGAQMLFRPQPAR
jgi:maltose alpha-D-glucosyltransferase/alpha-amylase